MIAVIDYLEAAGIDYKKSGKNVGPNDVNICCPWCGESKFHLSIHKEKGLLNCWVCKFEDLNKKPSFVNLIMELESVEYRAAVEILRVYQDEGSIIRREVERERPSKLELPIGCQPFFAPNFALVNFRDAALGYLNCRGFDMSTVDNYKLTFCVAGDYAYRIIVPIYFKNQLVNYTARDWTGISGLRYKNCHKDKCIVKTNELLYNYDSFKHSVDCGAEENGAFLVEGVTDVWRIGNNALGLMTNRMSDRQRDLLIGLNLDDLVIMLDPGSYSIGRSIAEELSPFIKNIRVVKLEGEKDVAELSYNEIIKLRMSTPFFEA
jgi:DNA primase